MFKRNLLLLSCLIATSINAAVITKDDLIYGKYSVNSGYEIGDRHTLMQTYDDKIKNIIDVNNLLDSLKEMADADFWGEPKTFHVKYTNNSGTIIYIFNAVSDQNKNPLIKNLTTMFTNEKGVVVQEQQFKFYYDQNDKLRKIIYHSQFYNKKQQMTYSSKTTILAENKEDAIRLYQLLDIRDDDLIENTQTNYKGEKEISKKLLIHSDCAINKMQQ